MGKSPKVKKWSVTLLFDKEGQQQISVKNTMHTTARESLGFALDLCSDLMEDGWMLKQYLVVDTVNSLTVLTSKPENNED